MNRLEATVKEIKDLGVVTYIYVESLGKELKIIKSKRPKWLEEGDSIYCEFQEASVCISSDCKKSISVENCIPGKLTNIRKSEPLCELTFQSEVGNVVSLITTDAFDALSIKEEDDLALLLRGIDINVEPKITVQNLKTYG